MKVYVYAKTNEEISSYEEVMRLLSSYASKKGERIEFLVKFDPKRHYNEYRLIKKAITKNDYMLIGSLSSIGRNEEESKSERNWFMSKRIPLLILDTPKTYENRLTVDETDDDEDYDEPSPLDDLPTEIPWDDEIPTRNRNIERLLTKFPDFPENWDELYPKWEKGEITSKSFMRDTSVSDEDFLQLVNKQRAKEALRAKYERDIENI